MRLVAAIKRAYTAPRSRRASSRRSSRKRVDSTLKPKRATLKDVTLAAIATVAVEPPAMTAAQMMGSIDAPEFRAHRTQRIRAFAALGPPDVPPVYPGTKT